jgi:peptide chain release factor subunit 3
MLPIVDKFKDMATVVMGKVESGQAKKGQALVLMPNRMSVNGLWSDDDEATAVGPGENVKMKLKGVEEEDVSQGFILCDLSSPCTVGRIFDAQVSG